MQDLLTALRNLIPFTRYAYAGRGEPCNLCGHAASIVVCETDRRLKRLTTVACAQCGLIRTDPMPTEEELVRYYATEYRRDYQWALSGPPPRHHLARSRREAGRRIHRLAPLLRHGSDVLDLGAGSGEFLVEAARHGHRPYGLEPSGSFAAFARREYGLRVEPLRWQEAGFGPARFDLITANHVLEHLRHPVAALRQMAGWLRDGGIIHIAVPDALGRRAHGFQHFHFAHVHSFTPQTLLWAGLVAGLEPDPRMPPAGTEIVFRKRAGGPVRPAWPPIDRVELARRYASIPPWRYLVSGRWLIEARRRLDKVVRDGAASRLSAGSKPRQAPQHRERLGTIGRPIE